MVDSAGLMDWKRLSDSALLARERAWAPYSGFKVGAAVLAASGEIYTGCNVENRSFGATICAERVAIGSAVANGETAIEAIAVVTDSNPPAPPCGLCLQFLTEFAAADLPVVTSNLAGEQRKFSLQELLPHPFEVPSDGLGKRQLT